MTGLKGKHRWAALSGVFDLFIVPDVPVLHLKSL